MNPSVAVVGLGAHTALGASWRACATAVRAGISRLQDHAFYKDQVGDPMKVAVSGVLEPAAQPLERMKALLHHPIAEATAAYAEKRGSGPPLATFVATGPLRPGLPERFARDLVQELTRVRGVSLEASSVCSVGNAAGVVALTEAVLLLAKRTVEACLVVAVDSYIGADTLEWLDGEQRLKSSVNRTGFIPGEAASAVLLASADFARRAHLPILGWIEGVGLSQEKALNHSDAVCTGEGLTQAIAMAVSGAPRAPLAAIYGDLNGDPYRNEEFIYAALRLPEFFDNPSAVQSPAAFWGDVGAASGPLALCLAAEAASRGQHKTALVFASSDGPERGAVLFRGQPVEEVMS